MRKSHIATPLVLITLLVACGIGSDGQTKLRPTPPALTSEVQEPQASESADNQNDANSKPWFEHYELNEVVVKIDPGALARSTESESSARATRVVPRPTREAYATRLRNLRQARESLLRENAALAAALESQTKRQNLEELSMLREQLENLKNRQRLVMTRTQTIEVEHQKLLSVVTRNVATVDLRTSN